MNVIFCCDPLNQKRVDPEWEREYTIAREMGINVLLFYYDSFKNDALSKPKISGKSPDKTESVIYRGWMMTVDMYKNFYESLQLQNLRLINSPVEYQHCYYLPDSYRIIEGLTPYTVVTNFSYMTNDSELARLLSPFGGKRIIVKDYVKSQKHYWNEACFIPDASDIEAVRNIVETFLKKQGDDFQGGLVFREYVDLSPVGMHPKSNMPLTQEYRLFVLNNKIIANNEYWDDGCYDDSARCDISQFQPVFNSVKSNFYTVDVAKKIDGEWIIIELGDGQVAEFLGSSGLDEFYCAIDKVE